MIIKDIVLDDIDSVNSYYTTQEVNAEDYLIAGSTVIITDYSKKHSDSKVYANSKTHILLKDGGIEDCYDICRDIKYILNDDKYSFSMQLQCTVFRNEECIYDNKSIVSQAGVSLIQYPELSVAFARSNKQEDKLLNGYSVCFAIPMKFNFILIDECEAKITMCRPDLDNINLKINKLIPNSSNGSK